MTRFSEIALSAAFAWLGLCAAGLPAHARGPEPPAVAAAPAVPEGAWGAGGYDSGEPRVEARLLIDPGDVDDRGVRVGVLFDLDPGWHLYWRNSGESGLPTRIAWQARGARPGPLHWPAPSSFDEADGLFLTYGYSDRVLLWSDLELEPGPSGERRIAAEIDLLVCRSECIPASFRLARSLDVARIDSPENAAMLALFEEASRRLPEVPAGLGVGIEARLSHSPLRPGDAFELAIAVRGQGWAPASGNRSFIADPPSGVQIEATGVELAPAAGEAARLLFEGRVEPGLESGSDLDGASARLTGVLSLKSRDGELRHVAVDLPLLFATEAAASGRLSLLHAILLALLGGLILNAMPCVLPVLAIKVFAVAEMAHRSRRDVRAQGIAYAAGILASMALLAGSVLALRAAGTWVGWGFQLQSPLFVSAVCALLVAFALNLFGVFEILVDTGPLASVGSQATGARRSFFEGLLAVALATPCSAPFLGTAVGFAFAGSAVVIVAVFLAIGAGLAAPFVLVSLVPGAARLVPRPGAWMLKLRAGLGFALLASVVWLLWVAGRTGGSEGMAMLIALLLALACALWIFGQLQALGRPRLTRTAGLAVLLLAVAGLHALGNGLAGPAEQVNDVVQAATETQAWRPWQPERVAEELERGRPVFVAFSADWCITCKANERFVLARPRVEGELARLGFATFKADWTLRDESIRLQLARFGKAGVPLYLVYDPAAPDAPQVLSEILGVDEVLAALRRAGARSRSQTVAVQTMREVLR